MYDVPKNSLVSAIDEVLALFGLYDRRSDKVKTYSGGMKRRINIAVALLHKPKILFMDEPTVGIDPQSRNMIFEVVEKLHHDGMTIVYTTHYMEEAERFCDRIGIIDHGQIIAEGTLDELRKSSHAKEGIAVTFQGLNEDIAKELTDFWEDSLRTDDDILFMTTDLKFDLSKIISKCNAIGAEINNTEIQKINLETIFLNLTGRQLRD